MKVEWLPEAQVLAPDIGLVTYKDVWKVTEAGGKDGLYARHVGFKDNNPDDFPKAMLN